MELFLYEIYMRDRVVGIYYLLLCCSAVKTAISDDARLAKRASRAVCRFWFRGNDL